MMLFGLFWVIMTLSPQPMEMKISPGILKTISVTGVTSLHSRLVLGRDSNKGLSSIQAKGTSKGCE